MELQIYIDGKFYKQSEAKISVFDHGFLYGDGIFEGIRSYEGKVFRLEGHLNRLYKSAERIALKIPLRKEELKGAVLLTLRKNELKDAYIRLIVSRGKGDLGLDPRKCQRPTVVIIADKISLYPESFYKQGLKIVVLATRRNHPKALDPRIKSLNYLNNILGKIEAMGRNAIEGIMLDYQGLVTECTGDNIFIIRQGKLLTPPVHLGLLEGITRAIILDMARQFKIASAEKEVKIEELYSADECFLTGTAAEIIPVVKIDEHIIGSGKPGKTTLRLIEEFHKLTKREGVPIY